MTLRRMASGWVDDERTCALPECGVPAPAEPHQREWPAKVADLRSLAKAYARLAAAKEAEAAALQREIESTTTPAWLCDGHRRHLHDFNLRHAWGGGRHDADDTGLIERTLAYLQANHLPGRGGACVVCRAGSKHSEEVLT